MTKTEKVFGSTEFSRAAVLAALDEEAARCIDGMEEWRIRHIAERISAMRDPLIAAPAPDIAQAVAAEREACAKICDRRDFDTNLGQEIHSPAQAADALARSIRARVPAREGER